MPDFGNIFGLDIEVSYIDLTITDFCHKPLATKVVVRNIMELSNEDINAHLKAETKKFFEKHPELSKKVKCAGIGFCGYSDQMGNLLASNTYYFKKLDLPGIIPANIPCFIDNNANVAALREQAIGLAFDKTNFVCIFIGGTGVGSGIVLDGRLFTGANGRAGEFGSSRRLWPDLTWEDPGMDTFIKLAARVAGLDYQLFDPERVYICGNIPNEADKIREEAARVFEIYGNSFKDMPLVEVVDIGPCGVAVGATVLARQCFLGSVEFASDVQLWRQMSLSA